MRRHHNFGCRRTAAVTTSDAAAVAAPATTVAPVDLQQVPHDSQETEKIRANLREASTLEPAAERESRETLSFVLAIWQKEESHEENILPTRHHNLADGPRNGPCPE